MLLSKATYNRSWGLFVVFGRNQPNEAVFVEIMWLDQNKGIVHAKMKFVLIMLEHQ